MNTIQPYNYYGHYYGNTVRKIYIAAALLMLGTYPFLAISIPTPYLFSIVAIVGLPILAGLLNPLKERVLIAAMVISAIAVIVFEYYAAYSFPKEKLFAIINQTLAIFFLLALYLITKTFRAEFLGHKIEEEKFHQIESKAEVVSLAIKEIEDKLQKSLGSEVERQDQALGDFIESIFKVEDGQSQEIKQLAFRLDLIEKSLRQIQNSLLQSQTTDSQPSSPEATEI